MTVAERISELERQQQQQQQQSQKYAYYDPDKRHKVSDPTLKAIQKKALLSFYERHQNSNIGGEKISYNYFTRYKITINLHTAINFIVNNLINLCIARKK